MFKKPVLIVLINLCAALFWPEAVQAVTCPPGTLFHTHGTLAGSPVTYCNGKIYTGSVNMDGLTIITHPNSIDEGDELVVYFDPMATIYSEENLDGGDDYIATCENKGGTLSPGIQIETGTESYFPVMEWSGGFSTRQGQGGEINTVTNNIFGELDFGEGIVCPNPNWVIKAAVPCAVDVTAAIRHPDNTETPLGIEYSCTLDDSGTPGVNECFTLGFNSTTGAFDGRNYTCSILSQ
ncbi:MAG: hypothetical protein ACU83N_05735 [Gammaproteobacteria bacterium]